MLTLNIWRAELGDESAVLDILRDAAIWLDKSGSDQWHSLLDPEQARIVVNKRFEEGEVFLGFLDGIAVATITLQWKDEFWGVFGNDPTSGYIHAMAVRRNYAGRGFGREILDWAGGYFAIAGKKVMRLDCLERSFKLCRYYDGLGFKTVGRKDWDGVPILKREK